MRALVTGASSGIGRAIARELVCQGADVVVLARRADRLQTLVAEIGQLGRRGCAVVGDVTDAATRLAAVRCAEEQLGGLDILVNNAGIAAAGRLDAAQPEQLRELWETNVVAVVEMTRVALPLLRRGNRPLVVNVASVLSHVAIAQMSAYCAAKFAVRGFSEALRAELFPDGIDVLVVNPGTVATEIWARAGRDESRTGWRTSPGVAPEFIAAQAVRAMRRGWHAVAPGFLTKLAILASRLFPGGVAWFTARRH
jgi:short-subunit dehydrogenase